MNLMGTAMRLTKQVINKSFTLLLWQPIKPLRRSFYLTFIFMMSIILFLSLLYAPFVNAFSFSVGAPTQCDSLDISWSGTLSLYTFDILAEIRSSGGSEPYFLHLIPVCQSNISQNI